MPELWDAGGGVWLGTPPCPAGHSCAAAPRGGWVPPAQAWGAPPGERWALTKSTFPLATDVRLPLRRSPPSPSLSLTHKDSPAGTPHPSPPTSTQPPRHRLAQLLLPNTAPLGPSPGNTGAGDPPLTTLSPPGHPPTAAVPPDTPSEAAAPPAPTGSPSSSPEGQGPPGDADPSAVPPASG